MTNSNAKLYRVLKAPIYTEKAQHLTDRLNVHVFKVDMKATKEQIKRAVETMFGDTSVEVLRVNTLVVKGKTKRFGRITGKRNDYKKAYVTLRRIDSELVPQTETVASDTATE